MRNRFHCVFALVAVLIAWVLMAPPASAQATAQFDLPAQPLADALRAAGDQSNFNILFDPKLVEGKQAPPLKARLSIAEAMSLLLEGTGLTPMFVDEKTITLVSAAAQQTPAPVVGEHQGEVIERRFFDRFRVAQAGMAGSDPQDRSDSPAAERKAAPMLEEIVVTAERRAEGAQDVPISISTFSGDILKQYIGDPYELANYTPNYQLEALAGLQGVSTATIRGLGSADRPSAITASSILTYYNGVPVGSPFLATIPQWDLDRIEVQRGPQGTLYGRNAVGGLIQYVTAAPSDEFEGYGEFTVGEFSTQRYEGAVSGPITEDIKARVSALSYDRGGDIDNIFHNVEQGEKDWWGVRGVFDWQVTDRLFASVKAQHFEGDVDPFEFNAAPSEFYPANVNGWLATLGVDADTQRESDYEITQAGLLDPLNELDFQMAEIDLNYDFGPVALTAVGGFLDGDDVTNNNPVAVPAPATDQLNTTDFRQWSSEVRLTSSTDHPLQWITGAFYQRTTDSLSNTIDLTALLRDLDGDGLTRHNADSPEDLLDGVLPAFPFSTIVSEGGAAQELETYALFLHTTYQWTERLTTTHAVRYSEENKSIDHRFSSLFEFPVSSGVTPGSLAQHNDFMNFASLTPAQQRQQAVLVISDPNTVDADGNVMPARLTASDQEVTWRFAADYALTDAALIYASVAKGFKGGIFSMLTGPDGAVSADPETSIVYETGAKTRSFDDRLQINVSAFYNDHTDFQTSLLTVQPSGGFANVVGNLPKSKLYGAELEIQAVPTENLFIAVNLGYLDSEITKVTPGNEALLGNELPFAEDFNFSGIVRYDVPTSLGTFAPQLSGRYRGKYWSQKENLDIPDKLGGFWTADLRLSYASPSGKLYGLLYWKNIFDVVEPVRNAAITTDAVLFGTTFSSINQRRNWGVTLGYRF